MKITAARLVQAHQSHGFGNGESIEFDGWLDRLPLRLRQFEMDVDDSVQAKQGCVSCLGLGCLSQRGQFQ